MIIADRKDIDLSNIDFQLKKKLGDVGKLKRKKCRVVTEAKILRK